MTTCTAVTPDDLFSLGHHLRVVQVRSRRITGRILLLQSREVTGDVPRLIPGEAEIRHGSHLLDQQLVTVVRALGVVEVEDKGQAVFLVIVLSQVAFLIWAVRVRALASIVNPTHEVIVVVFLSYPAEIGGEPPTHGIRPFAHRVACQATARLEAFLTFHGITRRLLGELPAKPLLPNECRDG